MSDANKIPETELEKELARELEEFKKEKERVKSIIGSLGGNVSGKKDALINAAFLVVVLTFFTLEVTTHFLPPLRFPGSGVTLPFHQDCLDDVFRP